jgi:hypothetical protein
MDTPTPDTTSESILFGPIEKLSNGNTYVFFAVLVLIFTGLMISLAFVSTTDTVNGETIPSPTGIRVLEAIGIALLTIAVVSVVLLLYIPTLKSVLQLVDKLRGAIFLFVFIFGLIVFYRNISGVTITNYRIIIVPIIAWMSMKMFSNAMAPSTEEEYTPNLQIEKMRVSLVYVAFVSFVVLMYSVDFGGFLREYMGPSATATLVLLVMGMIYLLTILSYPIMNPGKDGGSDKGMVAGLSWTGIGHGTFMCVTILLAFVGLFSNMSYFTDTDGVVSFKNTRTAQLFGVSITLLVLWVVFFSVRTFQDVSHTLDAAGRAQTDKVKSALNKVFLLLGGVAFFASMIYWFISITNSFNQTHSVMALLMNLVVVFVILIVMFKYLANTTHFQKSPYFRLAVGTLFYIPCLAYDILRSIFGMLGLTIPPLQSLASGVASGVASGAKGVAGKVMTVEKPAGKDMMTLATVLLAYVAYFFLIPYSLNKVAKQGGNVILQDPVPLSTVKSLGTYSKLNGIEDEAAIPVLSQVGVFNYTYAVSFWLYLDSSTASVSDNYYTVMNYNEMPHIMWNPKKAVMIFTVKTNTTDTDANGVVPISGSSAGDIDVGSVGDVAKNGNHVLLTLASLTMQKWNNLVVNYVNGTLDIFVNGELIQSSRQVVPEMTYGELTIGSPELAGKVCNVVYFNYSLEMKNVHYLYNMVKDTNPPIITDSYNGTTENTVYVNKVLDPIPKLVIPINIETNILDTVEQYADNAIDEVTPAYKPDANYLSMAWYFKQNKDEHNSASPEDGPVDDVIMPTLKTPIISGEMLPLSTPIGDPPKMTPS